MMLAPEKRTKFDFLNYAKSSAIMCMATSGFEPRSTRTTRRSETRYAGLPRPARQPARPRALAL